MFNAIAEKLTIHRMKALPVGDDLFRYYGPFTAYEFALLCFDCLMERFTKKYSDYADGAFIKRIRKKYGHAKVAEVLKVMKSFGADIKNLRKTCKDIGMYILKDAILPYPPSITTGLFLDTFLVYMKYSDCYDELKIGALFDILHEGPYGLRNDAVDVTVEAGDIVIDAGSWIGDFAAYASAKSATTYAFEPNEETYEFLMATADFNQNIHPVKKGLGDVKKTLTFAKEGISECNGIVSSELGGGDSLRDGIKLVEIETTTIDDFVEENSLERVDFIKADIEGYERHMLKGAAKTLKRFAPKLALCTYHLPDDPEVMEGLIKDANPAYNVVQKRKKLFASVPRARKEHNGRSINVCGV